MTRWFPRVRLLAALSAALCLAAPAHAGRRPPDAVEDAQVFARISKELAALTSGPDAGTPSNALEKGEAALAEGRLEDARRHAESARAGAAPGSPEAAAAESLLRRADAAPTVAGRIVVLLPLAGKFEAVGGQVREAFEFGWKAGGGTAGLVFVDSGAEAATAVAAVEQAALQDGAIAVVGPLLSDEADPAAAAADRLHLPMIALSQGLDEPAKYGWVYQAALTPREQITALVGWLSREKSLTRFGVFAPDDDYGQHAAQLFTEAVQAAGGTIGASASYKVDANVVTEAAAALARADSPKDNLEYDALFLPDNARRIPLACAGLAFEEFPLGTFAPHPNIRPIPLVGLNGYNSAQLVTAGNEYVRGSYFTDVFLPSGASERPVMAEFASGYKAALGRTPTSLEAAASDAGRLVATAVASGPATRDAFRAALLAARPTGTATGITAVDPEDHTLSREIMMLTIARGGIAVLATLPPD
jgi:ABC-type branched-subunit amino acid transport system substrate-binding protein